MWKAFGWDQEGIWDGFWKAFGVQLRTVPPPRPGCKLCLAGCKLGVAAVNWAWRGGCKLGLAGCKVDVAGCKVDVAAVNWAWRAVKWAWRPSTGPGWL